MTNVAAKPWILRRPLRAIIMGFLPCTPCPRTKLTRSSRNAQFSPYPEEPAVCRRDFLKTSQPWPAGVLAGGLSIGRSAHAAGSDVLKVGLIGCGGRGTGAAGNALTADPNTKLVAMADAFADRLEGSLTAPARAVRRPHRRGRTTLLRRLRRLPEADRERRGRGAPGRAAALPARSTSRPPSTPASTSSARSPWPSTPPASARVLATGEEARKKNLSLVSGLCWRYHHGVRETMKRVLDGAIGDILAIQETYLTGTLWRAQPRSPKWTEMEYQMRNWYYFTWLSGDHNVEQHVHSLDKALWAMHDEPPVRAWGLGGRQVRTEPEVRRHLRPPRRGLRVSPTACRSTPTAASRPAAGATCPTCSSAPRAAARRSSHSSR